MQGFVALLYPIPSFGKLLYLGSIVHLSHWRLTKRIDYGLDRLVQLAGETELDARAGDDRIDLADPLPDHSRLFRLCHCPSGEAKVALDGGAAVCIESGREPDFHSDSVWDAESSVGGGGYLDRLVDDHLDGDSCVAALSLGIGGSVALFRLGFSGNCFATVDHRSQLGTLSSACRRNVLFSLVRPSARVGTNGR